MAARQRYFSAIKDHQIDALSQAQQRALIEYVRDPLAAVGYGTRTSLVNMRLIRPTNPRHRAHHLTALGRDYALTILARQAESAAA